MPRKPKYTNKENKDNIQLAETWQDYALVLRALGNRRFELKFTDGSTRLGVLRGKIRKNKKNWIERTSWVLISYREYQEEKVDILHVYNKDHVKYLNKNDLISIDWANEQLYGQKDSDNVLFEDEEVPDDLGVDINEI